MFSLRLDKRGNPECDLAQLEIALQERVADEKFDVTTSDYFDSKEQAAKARGVYINSEKRVRRIRQNRLQ